LVPKGNFELPTTAHALGKIIKRIADAEGLNLDPALAAQFESRIGPKLFKHMIFCLQVAVSISPLVIFNTTNWSDISVRRDHLLSV
jgi:hypothetical protein